MNIDPEYVAEQTSKLIAAYISDEPLEPVIATAKAETVTAAMGALVIFEGVVRAHDGGEQVNSLTYSAHPSADRRITEVAQEVLAKNPDTRLWTAHRVGSLHIGDVAFVAVAASAHRAAAFAACSELCDAVKTQVPIWKEQELADGSIQWVGM